ncbi:hypothetical protein [Tardiphaga sp.]|uniref:hypothetical protein n=1 Tax=Tardiphaga sp. TaxID=1926292 RepID=UPI00262F3E28|nr:hypothetical protein [Tardiphaga sp.]MDB5615915.1 hypothetical protein [Tardiphaga sp.]
MRNVISKLVAAVALVTASAAPALACGGGGLFGGGCSPCGQAYVSPCGPTAGYGYAGGASYERLPDPSRYFYADRGPSFSGPGNYAPVPTYQETALSGPRGYGRPNYGYYDGGPYSNATNHYSYAEPAYRAPAVYSYRPRVRPSYRYGYSMQPRVRYGYAPRSYAPRYGYHQQRRHFAGPRVMYAPRYAAPRHAYPHYNQRPQRRMY